MSRLGKLVGKPLSIKLGGEDLEIYPLTMEDIPLFADLDSPDQKVKSLALASLIKKTLKKSVPDATEEELENVAVQFFPELTEAIMKVNGFSDDRVKSKPVKE